MRVVEDPTMKAGTPAIALMPMRAVGVELPTPMRPSEVIVVVAVAPKYALL
jgi:hypothetical protein